MVMQLEDLADYFRELSGEKGNEAIREQRARTVTQLFNSIMYLAPVDTGQFRASIKPQTGGPVNDYIEGMTTNPNTSKSVYEYAKNVPIDTPIWLGSGVPYAKRLEDGWSQQAPAGIFKIALARNMNEKVKLDLKL